MHSGDRSIAWRTHHENPCLDRCRLPANRILVDRRTHRRAHGRRTPAGAHAAILDLARRQRLRQRCDPPAGREQRRDAEHPPKANRKWKNCFSPFLYRNRNAIERMFGRLKDFRRIATRYDVSQFPRRHLPRSNRQLLVMSPDPCAGYCSSSRMRPQIPPLPLAPRRSCCDQHLAGQRAWCLDVWSRGSARFVAQPLCPPNLGL